MSLEDLYHDLAKLKFRITVENPLVIITEFIKVNGVKKYRELKLTHNSKDECFEAVEKLLKKHNGSSCVFSRLKHKNFKSYEDEIAGMDLEVNFQ